MKHIGVVRLATVVFFTAFILMVSSCIGEIVNIFGKAEFLLLQNGSPVSVDTPYDFGEVTIGSASVEVTFVIRNDGVADLKLPSGVSITGSSADQFSVVQDLVGVVVPDSETSFTLVFSPTGTAGVKNASAGIENQGVEIDGFFTFNITGKATPLPLGPSVTISSEVDEPTTVAPIPITISFTEEVSDFEISDVDVTGGTASNLEIVDTVTYTVQITPSLDPSDISISISEDAVLGIASNIGNEASNVFSITYDRSVGVPGDVENFAAQAGDSEILLSWSNPSELNFSGAEIRRDTGAYPTSVTDGVGVYAGAEETCVDSNLVNGATYYYTAFSYNSVTDYSTGVHTFATPTTSLPPPEVTGFSAEAGDMQVSLSWTNPSDVSFTGVRIQRSATGTPTGVSDGTTVYTGANENYQDEDLVNNTTYYYRIFAFTSAPTYSVGVSKYVTPADITAPGVVTGFTATSGEGEIVLTWANPTDADFAGVMVRRSDASFPMTLTEGDVAYAGSGTGFTDTGLEGETTYYYTAFTYDEVPNHSSGATISATTPVVSSLSLDMVLVEAGTFQMGSMAGEADEQPVHSVQLTRDFYISKYEITQAQWYEVMGTNHSYFTGDNLPVEKITWYDAVAFCNALSANEGLTAAYTGTGESLVCNFDNNGYRLPTEAEWEFAARGGKSSVGYSYSGSDIAAEVGWHIDNAESTTHAVGTKALNELGIYDMSGNVYEWCWDWYDSGSYSSSSVIDPVGPASASDKVVRGGSWGEGSYTLRVAHRHVGNPSLGNYASIGFRPVRSVNDSTPPSPVTNLVATPGSEEITLSWINPTDADFLGVMIRSSTSDYPTSAADGNLVYEGAVANYTHANLIGGNTYYYSAFAYDEVPNYAMGTQIDGISDVIPPTDMQFNKYAGNPVLGLGGNGSWDDKHAQLPSVVLKDDAFHMWYAGHDGTHHKIGYATSIDGVSWTKYSGNPVLNFGQPGVWDAHHVTNPSVIYHNDTFHLWYTGVPDTSGSNYQIGYATSLDGIIWIKHVSNPVIVPGTNGAWDDTWTQAGQVILHNNTFHMWYIGGDGSNRQIGYAYSSDGIHWTKYAGNPVLTIGASGAWDDSHVSSSSAVLLVSDTYHLWYTGYDGSHSQIGYAYSTDGIYWIKSANNPILGIGASGSWDDNGASIPSVIYYENSYHMWYSGSDGVNTRTGYATLVP